MRPIEAVACMVDSILLNNKKAGVSTGLFAEIPLIQSDPK